MDFKTDMRPYINALIVLIVSRVLTVHLAKISLIFLKVCFYERNHPRNNQTIVFIHASMYNTKVGT